MSDASIIAYKKNTLDIHLVRQIIGFNEVIKAQLAALEDDGSRVIDD